MAMLSKGIAATSMGTETEYTAALMERVRSHLVDIGLGGRPCCSNPSPLPTLDHLIANAEPSNPFRCQKCKAPLPLGSASQICAACGTRRDVAFDISFPSTLAYQYLMDSFQHDATPDDTSTKSTTNTEVANTQTRRTVWNDGLVAHDMSNLVLKWPEDQSVTSGKHSSNVPAANSNTPYRVDVDLEDFFGESKQGVSNVQNKSVTPREQIRGIELHAPDSIHYQFNPKDNNVDHYSSVLGLQNALYTEDDDPFISFTGNFKVAKPAIEIDGPKSLDPHTSFFAGDPFHLMEANEESSLAGNKQSAVNGKDFGKDIRNAISMRESWTQDDPWSSTIMEESHRGSSKNFSENFDSLSDWQEEYCSANSADLFSGSAWQQCDILQQNDLTEVMNKKYMAGENGVSELDVHPEPYCSPQGIKFEKEAASATDISGNGLSSRIGDKKGSKGKEDAMNNFSTAMPQGSSDTDPTQVVESLLSQMHDLSFMLADHLVTPGGHTEQ